MKKEIYQNWFQIKDKIQDIWPDIDDKDIKKIEEDKDRIFNIIKNKYGENKNEVEQTLKELIQIQDNTYCDDDDFYGIE